MQATKETSIKFRKLWKWRRGCRHKKRYVTREYAEREKTKILLYGNVLEAYLCEFCNKWHLGHP